MPQKNGYNMIPEFQMWLKGIEVIRIANLNCESYSHDWGDVTHIKCDRWELKNQISFWRIEKELEFTCSYIKFTEISRW